MHWMGWMVLALALFVGGWLTFDGVHALVKGDYVTPRSGTHAGQLGPWSKLVEAVGIEPRSSLMKWIHVVFGTAWMAVMICFALGLSWAWAAMLGFAIASLWYLPFGTLLGVVQIVLLLTPTLRGGGGT